MRKQVYDLTLDDLDRIPAWQFALDEETRAGQNEATVAPVEACGPIDPRAGICIVRATFVLADGTTLKGYLTGSTAGGHDLASIQPVIVKAQGQVGFWLGVLKPEPELLARWQQQLGAVGNLFPIHYRSDVELVGGPVAGTIPGFLYLTRDNHVRFARLPSPRRCSR